MFEFYFKIEARKIQDGVLLLKLYFDYLDFFKLDGGNRTFLFKFKKNCKKVTLNPEKLIPKIILFKKLASMTYLRPLKHNSATPL